MKCIICSKEVSEKVYPLHLKRCKERIKREKVEKAEKAEIDKKKEIDKKRN
jgi:hypothetical protein